MKRTFQWRHYGSRICLSPRPRGLSHDRITGDSQVINLVLAINWTVLGDWRHVAGEWPYTLSCRPVQIAKRQFHRDFAVSGKSGQKGWCSPRTKVCRPTHMPHGCCKKTRKKDGEEASLLAGWMPIAAATGLMQQAKVPLVSRRNHFFLLVSEQSGSPSFS